MSVFIFVKKAFTIDIPTAFTPNEKSNNTVYARGWGLQQLTKWQVFNRWGQLVFETTDINEGWMVTILEPRNQWILIFILLRAKKSAAG